MQAILQVFKNRDVRSSAPTNKSRTIFHKSMRDILQANPELCDSLIPLIPIYGRWDEVWKLADVSPSAKKAVERTILEQFRNDQESESPSLLCKWLPREKKNQEAEGAASEFAALLFPLITNYRQRMRQYRRTLSYLSNTAEQKMCAKSWDSINPDTIPRTLYRKNKNAFLNRLPFRSQGKIRYIPRYPDDKDRISCAEHFLTGVKRVYEMEETENTDTRYSPVIEALLGNFSPV